MDISHDGQGQLLMDEHLNPLYFVEHFCEGPKHMKPGHPSNQGLVEHGCTELSN